MDARWRKFENAFGRTYAAMMLWGKNERTVRLPFFSFGDWTG
jgi:hypothetical protein